MEKNPASRRKSRSKSCFFSAVAAQNSSFLKRSFCVRPPTRPGVYLSDDSRPSPALRARSAPHSKCT